MNVTCEIVRNNLSSYIDLELDEETAEEIEKHLSECRDCRKEYEFFKGISETAKNLPRLSVSSSLHDKIMACVADASEKAKKPKAPRRSLFRIASGFAAAAAVIAVSVISLNSLPGHPELTPENLTREIEKTAPPIVTLSPDPEQAETVAQQKPLEADKKNSTPAPKQESAQKNVESNPVETAPEKVRVLPPEMIREQEEEHAPAAASLAHDERILEEPAMEAEDLTTFDAASGGGGGSSVARNVAFYPVITYYVTQESYSEAVELVLGFEKNNEGYVIPCNDFSSLADRLEGLSGYLRDSGKETITEESSVLILQIEAE